MSRPKCLVRYTCDNSCLNGYHGVHICTANKHDKPTDNCLLTENYFTAAEKTAALLLELENITGCKFVRSPGKEAFIKKFKGRKGYQEKTQKPT